MLKVIEPARIKATAIHFSISALIGVLSALLVFGFWYPGAYSLMAGGQSLFILIVSVDLVLGPALTFVIFNPNKARRLLVMDLLVIATLQLAGLAYGLHTVYLARPVALVFEGTRFRIVSDVDIVHEELPQALPELSHLSLTGPLQLGTREPKDNAEKLKSINLAMQGIDTGKRPSFWQPYSASAKKAVAQARPLEELYKQYPDSRQEIEKILKKKRILAADMKFFPVIARAPDWSVMLDAKTGEIIDFIPYDGFF
jgi:hypothetical protein